MKARSASEGPGHTRRLRVGAKTQRYSCKAALQILQMYYFVRHTQSPGKPGHYLITMNDSQLSDLGGLKLSTVRRVVTSGSVPGARDTLQIYQRRTTTKWARGGTTPVGSDFEVWETVEPATIYSSVSHLLTEQ